MAGGEFSCLWRRLKIYLPHAERPTRNTDVCVPATLEAVSIASGPGKGAQPSTTVFNRVRLRNRAREVAVALPIAMATKVLTCGRFKHCTKSFRVADVAFRATSISVGTCQKPFGVTGEILKR